MNRFELQMGITNSLCRSLNHFPSVYSMYLPPMFPISFQQSEPNIQKALPLCQSTRWNWAWPQYRQRVFQ